MKSKNQLDKKLGILGGGQLGRMLIQKAIDFNIFTLVLDPEPKAPCAGIADSFTKGDFGDFETVYQFGKGLDMLTIEIENVNTFALQKLADEGVEVYPQPDVIALVQDKGLQKLFYRDHGFPTANFKLVADRAVLIAEKQPMPFFLKTRKAGYDGKGVMLIKNMEDLNMAFDEACVLEECVNYSKEISVIVARNQDGEVVNYPPVEMQFNKEANLVEYLLSPASLTESVVAKATDIALGIIRELNMVGILAVEMFVNEEGEVLVNEMAPRPHNSGHQTIEGNVTSQYEQHLRAIYNLPLGSTAICKPAVMINLLGEKGYTGAARYEGLQEVLALPGTYIHLYGKRETRPFRKMGHVTVTADQMEKARHIAEKVKKTIKVIA